MRDIYHELIRHQSDFTHHDDEMLTDSMDIYASAARGITSALTLIGNLTLDAVESEGYDNEDARRDLMLLGDTLRSLPRMVQAFEQCSDTASYTLRQRRAGESQ